MSDIHTHDMHMHALYVWHTFMTMCCVQSIHSYMAYIQHACKTCGTYTHTFMPLYVWYHAGHQWVSCVSDIHVCPIRIHLRVATCVTPMYAIWAWYTCMPYMHTLMFANMHDTEACHECMPYMHIKHTWHTCMMYRHDIHASLHAHLCLPAYMIYTHTCRLAYMDDINAHHMCVVIYMYAISIHSCLQTWMCPMHDIHAYHTCLPTWMTSMHTICVW